MTMRGKTSRSKGSSKSSKSSKSKSRSKGKGMLAPLILVPVELDRSRTKGGKHVYRLSWNGEDLQPNLSLQKKMRDDLHDAFSLTRSVSQI